MEVLFIYRSLFFNSGNICVLQQEKERGALIVLTCHDYSVLKELSDSIYFIEEGRVVGYERQ